MSTTQLCRTSDLPGVLGSRRDDPSAKTSESVFTRGIFRPVTDEITAEDLPVVGEIPKDLNGLFVRNGPNPFNATSSTYHWFDGDGMVHGVRFRDGKANYLNRYVQTASLEQQQRDQSNHGISLNDGFIEILRTAIRGFR
ncbi:MAG: carotenoid oxygenase family protein, partial [Planctomycetota bacterium]